MMNVYQSQAETVFQQHGHASKLDETTISPILFFLQGIIHNDTSNALYILKYICI